MRYGGNAMAIRVGINGFGRIGRQVLRATMERYPDLLEIVAFNDTHDAATNGHLFKYDTTYGIYPGTVEAGHDSLVVDGNPIRVFNELDPRKIPWTDVGVELVLECTGAFTSAEKASAHLAGTAKKVIISAPASDEDFMIVLGVNEDLYDPQQHHVISNASCTTNCVAPMIKVLHENFGIRHGLMSTIHAYTNDQKILDGNHRDLRRARAAAQNIIPTTTGAARSVGLIIPELQGKLHGLAFRVPVSTVSITDLVVTVTQEVNVEQINDAFKVASETHLKNILGYTEEPLVSSDFIGNSYSCTIDAISTMVTGSTMVKVLGWYDNEWGYACRTADLAAFVTQKGL
jgi:glyceraldehyde 3-phosphate dehydrogenase